MRYIVKLSYDGSKFCGWQIQREAPSVQQELQNALSKLLREDIPVTGAGRTDTGVNASGYIAHFDTSSEIRFDAGDLAYKLNAILPRGIVIHSISKTDDNFHARFGATARSYRYFINKKKDPFISAWSWQCGYPLDLNLMNKAAEALLGTHDFSCFEKTGGSNATSICTISKASWSYYTPTHVRMLDYPADDGDYLVFEIRADRFLRNMVRAIVGSLIEVGRGKREVSWISELVSSGTRSDAGESVPGNGLFFCGAEYDLFGKEEEKEYL